MPNNNCPDKHSSNNRNRNNSNDYWRRNHDRDESNRQPSNKYRKHNNYHEKQSKYQGKYKGDARNKLNGNKQQNNNSNNSKPTEPEITGPKDTELFMGAVPFLKTERQIYEMRIRLQKPNSMYLYEVENSNFPTIKLKEEKYKVRSLLIDIGNSWYKDIFDKKGKFKKEITAATAVAKITTDIAKPVSFYKPARTYVQVFDPADECDSDFGATIAWVCYKQGYVLIDLNGVGRTKIDETPEEHRVKVWRSRIQSVLKEYNPKDREVSSPAKGIDCNEIHFR